jgi:hypothetical protein
MVHGQRMLSRDLDAASFDDLLPQLPEELRARLVSAKAPHANAWMTPSPGADQPRWLQPGEWDVLFRCRPLQPIYEAGTICGNCLRHPCDIYADHAVSCMHGPDAIHNAIRNTMTPYVRLRSSPRRLSLPTSQKTGPTSFVSAVRLVVVDVAMTTVATRRLPRGRRYPSVCVWGFCADDACAKLLRQLRKQLIEGGRAQLSSRNALPMYPWMEQSRTKSLR